MMNQDDVIDYCVHCGRRPIFRDSSNAEPDGTKARVTKDFRTAPKLRHKKGRCPK